MKTIKFVSMISIAMLAIMILAALLPDVSAAKRFHRNYEDACGEGENPVDSCQGDSWTGDDECGDGFCDDGEEISCPADCNEDEENDEDMDFDFSSFGMKKDAISSLKPLESKYKEVKKAISALEKTMAAENWADNDHLSAKGKETMSADKNAVILLEKLMSKKKNGPSKAEMRIMDDAVWTICDVDYALAETLWYDADDKHAGKRKPVEFDRITSAIENSLDKAFEKEKCSESIDFLKNAWKNAQRLFAAPRIGGNPRK